MKIKEILKCFLRQFDAENTVDYICGTEALPLPLSPEEESWASWSTARRRTR